MRSSLTITVVFIITTTSLPGTHNAPARQCRCSFDDWSSILNCSACSSIPQRAELEGVPDSTNIFQLEMSQACVILVIDSSSFQSYDSLSWINLEGCSIQNVIDGAFRGCRNQLQTLRLGNNQIQTLGNAFSDLPHLKKLYLTLNQISNIDPTAFSNVPLLETLYLNNNRIQTLPTGIFQTLPKLRFLHLEGNSITSIPAHFFQQSSNLLNFYAQDNAIATISPEAFSGNPLLEEINLRDNMLRQFPSDILNNLPNLSFLDISMNNLTCFCSMLHLKLWLQRMDDNSIPTCWLHDKISLSELSQNNCILWISQPTYIDEVISTTMKIKDRTKPISITTTATTMQRKSTEQFINTGRLPTSHNAPKVTKMSEKVPLQQDISKTDHNYTPKKLPLVRQNNKEGSSIPLFMIIIVAAMGFALLLLLILGFLAYCRFRALDRSNNINRKDAKRTTQNSNHTYASIQSREPLPSCSSVGSADSADSSSLLLGPTSAKSSVSSGSSKPIESQYYEDNISITSSRSHGSSSSYNFDDSTQIIFVGVNQSGRGASRKFSRSLNTDKPYLTPIPEQRDAHNDPLPPCPRDGGFEGTQEPDYIDHETLQQMLNSQKT